MLQKVSIIVPVYNSEHYLGACIESVLSQDYQNFRLILIDDGSTDKSAAICESYSDERIVLIRKENGGVSSARNVGLQFVREKRDVLFTFLDSDDTLPTNAISSLVYTLECTKADIAVGAFRYVYGGRYIKHSSRLQPGEYEVETLLPRFIDDGSLSGFLLGSVWGALYKMEIATTITFNPKIKYNEDGLFNLEYILNAKKLSVVADVVYNYRQYGTSSCSKRAKTDDYNKLIVERIKDLTKEKEIACLEAQLSARNVSVALWDILLYPGSMGFKEANRFIKERINAKDVRDGIHCLKYKELRRYKKVFAYLIRFRCNTLLCIAVKMMYPYLRSRLRR